MSDTTDYSVKEFKHGNRRDMSLFGALPHGESFTFSITAEGFGHTILSVVMVIHADGWNGGETVYRYLPLSPTENGFALTVDTAELCEKAGLCDNGLFYYHYRMDTNEGTLFFGGEAPIALCPINGRDNERQLTVYAGDYAASEHLQSGVIYHIFVDRFNKSGRCGVKDGAILDEDWESGVPQYGEYPGAEVANNVFFGGDLYGVAEKLPYIKSLGTSTIYLSPVFDAASNHKYDTGNYLSVDEMFGGGEALTHLCHEAKKHGINIILDGVFNHTGSDSVYFNQFGKYDSVGAYQSEDSPYYHWYFFRDFPDEYECWWGVKILPKVNTASDDFRSFIFDSVIPKWMDAGVSGWRLDVADELDEGFLEGLRTAVKAKNPDGAIIGEVWEDASDKVSYGRRRHYLRGHQLDSVMNYPLRDGIIAYILRGDCELFRRNTETLYRRYPKLSSDSQMNFLGTHDTVRILSMLGDDSFEGLTNEELSTRKMTKKDRTAAIRLLKLAYGILVAVPGVPCIFYGDEVGMEGYRDPFCRKTFPWHELTEGSAAEDLLSYYQRLGEIRQTEPVFNGGLFRIIEANEDFIILRRYNETDSITIIANRSDMDLSFPVDTPVTELISGRTVKSSPVVKRKSVAYLKKYKND
ncbi:MAG: glycoside hydrolase family 13 protein [Ruminococcaceae bacterium]|nr:glycoside hydrolase family 13 protein [Oscillospiraceae bacterium]